MTRIYKKRNLSDAFDQIADDDLQENSVNDAGKTAGGEDVDNDEDEDEDEDDDEDEDEDE